MDFFLRGDSSYMLVINQCLCTILRKTFLISDTNLRDLPSLTSGYIVHYIISLYIYIYYISIRLYLYLYLLYISRYLDIIDRYRYNI